MKAASFEQRKITALAISSVVPSRPRGMFAAMDAELKGEPAAAAVRKNPSSRGVAVGPGCNWLAHEPESNLSEGGLPCRKGL